MLKTGLKNFFKNILFVFVPMGVMYLFLILAACTLVTRVFAEAGVMFDNISQLISSTVSGSKEVVRGFIEHLSGSVDWSGDPQVILDQISDTNWLGGVLNEFLESMNVSTEGFTDALAGYVQTFISAVISVFKVSVAMIIVSVFLAYFITGIVLRGQVAKRNIKQWLLSRLLAPLLSMFATVLLVWLTAKIKGYVILLWTLYFIIYEAASLAFTWLVFRSENLKVEIKEVVNIKNILMCFLTVIIIVLITVAIFLLVMLINILVAVLIAVPFIIYSQQILSVNADSYVKSLMNKGAKSK